MMKVFLSLLAAAMALSAASSHGQQGEEDHSAHHPKAEQEAPAGGQDSAARSENMQAMQQNMQRIRQLMTKIQETADADVRRQLMAEHLQAMREQVKMMRAAAGSKMRMMGGRATSSQDQAGAQHQHGDANQPDMAAPQTAGTNEPPGQRPSAMKDRMGGMMMHQRMEQRMDMLEQLLEQLIEREAVEQ
jgi:hypothetical protein